MQTSGESIGYLPVSRVAVAAAAMGVLSSLALATPMLWILPLVGIALAVTALADVARPGAEKAGRLAALAGLALSVGFGMQAVTSAVVSRRIAESRAEAVVHAWLDALGEHRLSDARSMISPQVLPPPVSPDHPPGPHEDHSHGADIAGSIEELAAVQAVLRCGTAAVRDVRSTGRDEESGTHWCARVRLSPCGDGSAVEVLLQLAPTVVNEPKRRVERWTITKIDLGGGR